MKQESVTSKVAKPKQGVVHPTGSIEEERQTSDLRSRWNWVEKSIWTDNMLAALENGVKGGKWFSLIDKVMKTETLYQAWMKVRANRGAGGVDNITINKFEANCFKYLTEIQEDLQKERYRPKAVKRVNIPKGDGTTRPLGIPVIKDKVVQMALKMTLEPIFEKDFHPNSFGFRPQKGAKDALREVDRLLKKGYLHVVDVDFESFFDSIPHDRLLQLIEERISDGRVLKLLAQFLSQEVLEGMQGWVPTKGTPQGGVISPLLANIYLNPLDYLADDLDVTLIRYADDFVVLTRTREEAERLMVAITQWSNKVGLAVHPEKTKLIDYARGEGFDFLGYHFCCGFRKPRDKSFKRLKDAIRKKTRRTCGRAMNCIIADLNPVLRGWYGYFKHANQSWLRLVDQTVRRRLRAIYRKQEKRPGQGHTPADHLRWRNSHFANLGLFTLLEAAKLTASNRQPKLACQSR